MVKGVKIAQFAMI